MEGVCRILGFDVAATGHTAATPVGTPKSPARVRAAMPFLGVDHVADAVNDLDDATRIYERILGLKASHDQTVADHGVKTRFFPVPGGISTVEALVGLGPETPVGKFLA